MSNRILLSVLAYKLAAEDVPRKVDEQVKAALIALYLNEFDKQVKNAVLSGAVSLFAGERQIDRFIRLDTIVDVGRNRVSIPIGVDPALGRWGRGLTRFKLFESVYIDEAEARAWLRKKVGGSVEQAQRRRHKENPKRDEFEAHHASSDRTDAQIAHDLRVTQRTIGRWRRGLCLKMSEDV